MKKEVEINGLDRYLDKACSERAVKALNRLFHMGMQEVRVLDGRASEKDAGENWRTEFFRIKCAIASDPNASPVLLNRLVQSYEPAVLVRIAENPRADAHTLASLACKPDAEVRMAVAENANAPLATLVALAFDESADVRYCLAENHNISRQILALLVDDENPYVSRRAALTLDRLQAVEQNRFWCAA
jgi:hypothetical protein